MNVQRNHLRMELHPLLSVFREDDISDNAELQGEGVHLSTYMDT